MFAALLIMLAGFTAATTPQGDDGIRWYEDVAAAFKAAEQQNKTLMVFVYVKGCAWSKMLEEKTLGDKAVCAVGENLISLKIRGDDEAEGQKLSDRYRIKDHPTVIFLKPDGREIDRIQGYLKPAKFLKAAEAILAGEGTFLALSEKAESWAILQSERLLLAEKYLERRMTSEALEHARRAAQDATGKETAMVEQSLLLAAQICVKEGQFDAAERDLLRLHSEFSESEEAAKVLFLLVFTNSKLGREAEAWRFFEELKSRFPDQQRLIFLARQKLPR